MCSVASAMALSPKGGIHDPLGRENARNVSQFRRCRARADRFGAKLPDLAVLVNNERGEDRRDDGKYASDHGHKF